MTGSQPRNPRKEMIGNSIAERVEELACLGRPPTATSGGGLTLADSSTSGQNASMPRSWGMSPCETFACPHCGQSTLCAILSCPSAIATAYIAKFVIKK